MTHYVTWGVPDPRGKGRFGAPSKPERKHAIANCSQTVSLMLPPGEYKRAIPPFAKLLWSLLFYMLPTPDSPFLLWR